MKPVSSTSASGKGYSWLPHTHLVISCEASSSSSSSSGAGDEVCSAGGGDWLWDCNELRRFRGEGGEGFADEVFECWGAA